MNGLPIKYRQYFRGGRPAPPQDEAGFAPIEASFIAAPYRSVNDARPLLAFTAPIWPSNGEREKPLGVLGMTIAVYELTSLDHLLQGSSSDSTINLDQVLTIVYAKPDFFDGKAERDGGLIMQHPAFQPAEAGAERPEFRPTYLDESLLAKVRADAPQAISLADYRDPLAAVDEEFEGHWAAAVAPVSLEAYDGRDPSLAEPGWCVIVQRRVETATAPE